jgi:hypothetical protein
MIPWVLVILGAIGQAGGVTTVEFENKRDCENARAALEASAEKAWTYGFVGVCIPKRGVF